MLRYKQGECQLDGFLDLYFRIESSYHEHQRELSCKIIQGGQFPSLPFPIYGQLTFSDLLHFLKRGIQDVHFVFHFGNH